MVQQHDETAQDASSGLMIVSAEMKVNSVSVIHSGSAE